MRNDDNLLPKGLPSYNAILLIGGQLWGLRSGDHCPVTQSKTGERNGIREDYPSAW